MIIKANTHAPLRLPEIIGQSRILRYAVEFTPSCRYKIGGDQSDINKLFGIGYFPYHRLNSVRFGWRYTSNDHIDIFAYWYKDGERSWKMMGQVPIGREHIFVLTPGLTNHTLQVYGRGMACTVPVYRQGWGYLLRPYFGGNQKAPHDIEIKIKEL